MTAFEQNVLDTVGPTMASLPLWLQIPIGFVIVIGGLYMALIILFIAASVLNHISPGR